MSGVRTRTGVAQAQWTPRGVLLESPGGPPGWTERYVALPWMDTSTEQLWLYFSGRDERGRARISRIRVEAGDGQLSTTGDAQPVLDFGALGTYEDAGVTMSCVVRHNGRLLLYYTGWFLGTSVPFTLFAGLAVSDDDGASFHRVSEAPLLERSAVDPLLTASPVVLVDGDELRMWYISALKWDVVDGEPRHWYHMRYADSVDGMLWNRTGEVALDFASDDEYAIARASVVRDGDEYVMWTCARGSEYRLVCATSPDARIWQRVPSDVAGLTPLATGFASDAQCYPMVFERDGTWYLLYNGNGYGRTGVGYASWTP